LIFGECLTLQRKDQPYTADLIFFIISVGFSSITRKTYSMWPKVLAHVKKKSLYNQPKPYFFKKLL